MVHTWVALEGQEIKTFRTSKQLKDYVGCNMTVLYKRIKNKNKDSKRRSSPYFTNKLKVYRVPVNLDVGKITIDYLLDLDSKDEMD